MKQDRTRRGWTVPLEGLPCLMEITVSPGSNENRGSWTSRGTLATGLFPTDQEGSLLHPTPRSVVELGRVSVSGWIQLAEAEIRVPGVIGSSLFLCPPCSGFSSSSCLGSQHLCPTGWPLSPHTVGRSWSPPLTPVSPRLPDPTPTPLAARVHHDTPQYTHHSYS